MSTLQEVQASLDALSAKVDSDAAQAAEAVGLLQALTVTISDLRAQLDANAPVTKVQLDALGAQVVDIAARLTASDDTLASGIAGATPAP